MKSQQIKDTIKERYGSLAEQQINADNVIPLATGCCGDSAGASSSCCGPKTDMSQAEALYAQGDLSALPATVTDISLGCGNPHAIAALKPGETVLDLGSGGGIDCFIAAKAVGPSGRVIGVDMTDSMLALANKNKAKLGADNVEFRKGEIEALPVESGSVDSIISNCVINLSPDKAAVFREAFRVLKPGGRLAVSDIVTEGEILQRLRDNLIAWAECITGAIDQGEYLDQLRRAGFVNVAVQSRTGYGPDSLAELDEESRSALPGGINVADFSPDTGIYSAQIVAYKPA